MLDFSIRHVTQNKKTLDDVMRLLYYKYYKQLKRGFTEMEFKMECEKIAGTPLPELFEYASTVKPPDYPKYFAYGGLNIDTATTTVSTTWSGLNMRMLRDTMRIINVDFQSPAWNKGIRSRTKVLTIDGIPASPEAFKKAMEGKKEGDTLNITTEKDGVKQEVAIGLAQKREKSFKITPMISPNQLQAAIYKSWVGK